MVAPLWELCRSDRGDAYREAWDRLGLETVASVETPGPSAKEKFDHCRFRGELPVMEGQRTKKRKCAVG